MWQKNLLSNKKSALLQNHAGISLNKYDKYSTNLTIGESKRVHCGSCSVCTRDDCGQCRYCLDIIKFEGAGKKRHTCILGKCPEMSALKDLQSKQEGAFLKVPIKSVIGTNIVTNNRQIYSYVHSVCNAVKAVFMIRTHKNEDTYIIHIYLVMVPNGALSYQLTWKIRTLW